MKKTKTTVHQAAAILIDVLLVVLVLLAFVFVNESVKPATEAKLAPRPAAYVPKTTMRSRGERSTWSPAAEPKAQATYLQVRNEGGRLVPIFSR